MSRVLLLTMLAVMLVACGYNPKPKKKGDATTVASSPVASSSVATAKSNPPVASASPTPTYFMAPPPPKVKPIKRLPDPTGVVFVHQKEWMREGQSPDNSRLEAMPHPGNVPVMDIIVQHSVTLCTPDTEVKVLQGIMDAHMKRKWGHVSAHYLIGPSGKVYQGRFPHYRADGTPGTGLGRHRHNWNKIVIMLLGNFGHPDQEFTEEAKNALMTLIEDRKGHFDPRYRRELEAREAETIGLLGSSYDGQPLGQDEVRVLAHPSLHQSVKDFLGGNTSAKK